MPGGPKRYRQEKWAGANPAHYHVSINGDLQGVPVPGYCADQSPHMSFDMRSSLIHLECPSTKE